MKTSTKAFWLGAALIACLGLLPAVPKMICYAATVQEWLRDGFVVSGNPLKVVTTNDTNADAQYSPSGTTKKGLVIQGNGSQTANLFETQFSNGTAIFGITADGASKYTGIATASAPATSGASNGTIYFDSTLNKFMASLNNGAYAQIATGSGGFPVSSSGAGTPVILSSSSTTITGTGNVIAFANTASGATLTSGTGNTIIGNAADVGANTAANSVAIGNTAISPTGCIVIGALSGKAGSTGTRDVFIGQGIGTALTSGTGNIVIGSNGTGNGIVGSSFEVLIGDGAGPVSTAGRNVYIGHSAGLTAAAAGDIANVFIGYRTCESANGSATGLNTVVGQLAGSTLTTGSKNVLIGSTANVNAGSSASVIAIGPGASGSSSSIIISVAALNSSTTNDLYIGSGDTGFNRVAAGVVRPNTGNAGTTLGWGQDGGIARMTTAPTNATATMSNLTDLTINVAAGRKYVGRIVIIAKNSTGAEGLQFDLNGGGATMTSYQFTAEETPIGATLGTTTTTTLGTALTNTVVATSDVAYCYMVSFVVNAGGTVIPRFAEVSHTTGTATVEIGSCFDLHDSQN